MDYNAEATRQLESIYQTDDAVVRRSTLLNALSPAIDEHVIDIGTGPGFVASEIADRVGRGGSVTAVDNSDDSLRLAKIRCCNQSQVSIQHANATDLPFRSDVFDVAVSVQVFEYIDDVDIAIREMYRVLKPGGRAALIATDWDSIIWQATDADLMRRVLGAWEEHCAHTNLPRTLLPRLRKVGFDIINSQPLQQFATEDSEDKYVHQIVPFISAFVIGRQGLTRDDLKRWSQDLSNCGQNGEYFFWLNQLVVIAQKPSHDRRFQSPYAFKAPMYNYSSS